MKKALTSILVLALIVGSSGCTALAIGAGVAALAVFDKSLKDSRAACRAQEARQQEMVRQHHERQERLAREQAEQQAKIEREKAERRQKQQAADAARMQQELHRRQEVARESERARKLAAQIEEALIKTNWSRSQLDGFLKESGQINESMVLHDVLGRMHLALGLYAWHVGDIKLAMTEWTAARRFGMDDARAVAPSIWTPRAVESFDSTSRR